MKRLIIFTIVASGLRALLDVAFSFFDIPGYQKLRAAIYGDNATNWEQFYWYRWRLRGSSNY